jgi:hypothetical protein
MGLNDDYLAEEEARRTRERYYEAMRAGLSVADASACANGKLAICLPPARSETELPVAPSIVPNGGAAESDPTGGGTKSVLGRNSAASAAGDLTG